jgi:hypothetical protein
MHYMERLKAPLPAVAEAESSSSSSEETSSNGEIISTEQEYQQTQMEETTWEQLTETLKKKDAAQTVDRMKRKEEFFRNRRGLGGSSGGSGGGGGSNDTEEHVELPDELGSMQIFVTMPSGTTTTLDVEASDTIMVVKAMIQVKEGIPRSQQRLIFASSDLEDCATLEDAGVYHGATLHMALRIEGGSPKRKGCELDEVDMILAGRPLTCANDHPFVISALAAIPMKTEEEFSKWLLEMEETRFNRVYDDMTSSARTGNLKSLANVFLPGLLEFHNVKDYIFDTLPWAC